MDYGFTVRQLQDWNDPAYEAAVKEFVAARTDGPFGWMADPDRPRPPLADSWDVYLPHQCDAWQITEETNGGVDYAVAVAALEKFIDQAQQALYALLERRESGV